MTNRRRRQQRWLQSLALLRESLENRDHDAEVAFQKRVREFLDKVAPQGQSERTRLWKRDGGWRAMGVRYATCRYCGKPSELRRLTRDHVVPIAKGGARDISNQVLACYECNTRKGHHIYWWPIMPKGEQHGGQS